MDAEHRHELKENDLAEFLAHFGQWWGTHGTKVLTVLLVLAAVVTGRYWLATRAATATEKAWRDLTGTTSPDGYRAVALSHQDPAVRALAYLRGADLLLVRAAVPPDHEASGADSDGAPSNAQQPPDVSQDLDSAALMYQQVIGDDHIHPVYKLNAQLGLAAAAEGRRDWNKARDLYGQVMDAAGTRYAAIGEQAQARLAMLDRLKKPVIFGPDTAPAQPATNDAAAAGSVTAEIDQPSATEEPGTP